LVFGTPSYLARNVPSIATVNTRVTVTRTPKRCNVTTLSTWIRVTAMTFFRTGGKPESASRKYKLIRVPHGGRITFICKSAFWVDCLTHYDGKGTVICPGPAECEWCRRCRAAIWKGYVFGSSLSTGITCAIELTAGAAFDLSLPRNGNGKSILGAEILVERYGDKDNGPCAAEIIGWHENTEPISDDELKVFLSTFYRVPSARWRKAI